MLLKNAWYVGAWGTEVGRQNLLRRTLLNEPVVFFRQEDGTPVALADKCAHRHAPLSSGKLVGDNIQCPYHGLEYDASGECVRVPGQSTVPPGCRVQSYPVVERYQWVWIWMGDPELANPDDIEDFHWMDDPDWRAKGELLHLKGDYKLLVENLLDLSHLSYIHATTLGTDAVAETPMKFERGDRHVTVTRWVMDSVPPPFFTKAGGFGEDEHVDRWQHITWTPPAFVRLDVGAAKAGTGAETATGHRASPCATSTPSRRKPTRRPITSGPRRTISVPTSRGSPTCWSPTCTRRSSRIWRSSPCSRKTSTAAPRRSASTSITTAAACRPSVRSTR